MLNNNNNNNNNNSEWSCPYKEVGVARYSHWVLPLVEQRWRQRTLSVWA
jgi:hypothetical protein